MKRNNRRQSLVVYRGPSAYDPSAIIRAVLVLRSRNAKTGDMAQLFILPECIAPTTAQITGADFSVCGACPLRPASGGGCYVVTAQGPLSTWKATTGQPVAGAGEVSGALVGRSVRLGAYGDAAALPRFVVDHLARAAGGRVTGYTHGHRVLGLAGVEHLRRWAMLSTEAREETLAAHAAGWRTFRARPAGAPLLASEIDCPADTRGVECRACLLCRGTTLPRARSVSIPVHGTRVSSALRVVAG